MSKHSSDRGHSPEPLQDYVNLLLGGGADDQPAGVEHMAANDASVSRAPEPELPATQPPATEPAAAAKTQPLSEQVPRNAPSTSDYPNSLFSPEEQRAIDAVAEQVAKPAVALSAQQEEVPQRQYAEPLRIKLPLPRLKPAETLPETAAAESTVSEVANSREWLANGRPAWAQQPFECLLFYVGGLTLAVPLSELGSIYSLEDGLTPLFGRAEWFMGLLAIKTGNLRVVDTGQLVMPERYKEGMRDEYRYGLSINQMDWCLAVDKVSDAILLQPEEVKWRSERSKRPWLAGTVVEHMCALMDVSQLADMFEANGVQQ